jgi:Sigma-70 region 2
VPIGLNHLTGTPRPPTGKQGLVSPSPSDWELVLASREDPQAFVGIFERYFDEIHGYLRGRVGRSTGAELASETFAQAFAGRGRFDPRRGEVRAWLYAIAVNLLRHHYRRERRQLRAYARTGVEPVAAGDEALAPLDADVAGPACGAERERAGDPAHVPPGPSSAMPRSRRRSASQSAPCARGSALTGLRHAEGNALLTRLSALGTPIGNRLLESTLFLLRKIRRLSPLNIDGVTSTALRAFQI